MRRQKAIEKPWILQNSIEHFIVREVEELSINQAHRLVSLIKNKCESAYIARYREDVHGGLPPEKIRKAMEAYFNAVELNKKVSTAISSVTSKVVGVHEQQTLIERLKKSEDIEEVTEISKEFGTGARKTKANLARELGLEPPAKSILEGELVDFKSFLSNNLKTVKDVENHLKICLADLINRDAEVIKEASKIAKLETPSSLQIISTLTRDAAKNKEELERKNLLTKYNEYIGLTRRVKYIREHQVSALNRGSEEGIISWKVDFNLEDAKKLHPFSQKKVNFGMRNFFQEALRYSISTYFVPMVERYTKKILTRNAESRSIQIFGENIEQLFAQKGVHSKYIIALDPGNIVKTAFLKPSGQVIAMDQFSIHGSTFDRRGIDLLKKWALQTGGKDIVFAIGNGSNTHNTQTAVSKLIENNDFPKEINVRFCVVPEHGASKYSCTSAAVEEFGENTDIKQISAVSIGRRLIDPMSEYVKIEPQHLGKGQYQLSVDEKLLKRKLVAVVRDRVSMIGVDLNLASKHLLQNVCGLNESLAVEIVKYREEHGRFKSRKELKKVKGIGEVTFQQCAGFLTVRRPEETDTDGPPAKRFKAASGNPEWSPLDETVVHPDDYEVAEKLLKKLNMRIEEVTHRIGNLSISLTEDESRIMELLKSKPDLKEPPLMMKKVRAMIDLDVGQKYTGTVCNKTDFGLFIDIGVERDGLAHISHFRGKLDIPQVGDVIEVYVKSLTDGKISLQPI